MRRAEIIGIRILAAFYHQFVREERARPGNARNGSLFGLRAKSCGEINQEPPCSRCGARLEAGTDGAASAATP
jgi:hypothetical protein